MLYDSTYCQASCNGDIIRLKPGIETNIRNIIADSGDIGIEIPSEYISVTGFIDGFEIELPILTSEYHNDASILVWLDDVDTKEFDRIEISFKNPSKNPNLSLCYVDSIDINNNDTIWKLLPDIVRQPIPIVEEVQNWNYKLHSTSLDDRKNCIPPETNSIEVCFSAPVDSDIMSQTSARMVSVYGTEEIWYVESFRNEKYYSYVVFRRASEENCHLKDFCFFEMNNVVFEKNNDWITSYSLPVYIGDRLELVSRIEEFSSSFPNCMTHYGIDGRKIAADSPGLHVIRSDDGKVRKTLVK